MLFHDSLRVWLSRKQDGLPVAPLFLYYAPSSTLCHIYAI